MINRQHRFHGYNSLTYAYRHGQTARGAQLGLRYVINRRRQTFRVAVVVSRKVDKSAVVRNRIRRRIYEIVRLEAASISAPYDLIFTAFSNQLADMEAEQLKKLVSGYLVKAGAQRKP